MHYKLNNTGIKTTDVILYIVCFVTILSQLPFFVDRGFSSPLATGAWILMFFVVAYPMIINRGRLALPKTIGVIVFETVLLLLFRLFASFASNGSIYINIERNIVLAVFILITGFFCGTIISRNSLEFFSTVYIWATVIVTAVLYITVLRHSDFSNIVYTYASKNSIGQIILSAVILILTRRLTNGTTVLRLIYGGMALFLTYCLVIMKTRACIVFIPVIIFLLLSKLNINKKLKRILFAVVIVSIVVLLLNKELYQKFIIDLLFRGDTSFDLERASSGRFSQWVSFGERFLKHPIIGKTPQQYESLIITSYLENGIVFGTVIIHLALFPLCWSLKYLNKREAWFPTVLLLSICYTGNGIFEQYAPFGPGVKCFLLWFLIGCLISIIKREKSTFEAQGVNNK